MIRVCRHCGREFESKRASFYCDLPECRAAKQEYDRVYKHIWHLANRRRLTAQQRVEHTKPRKNDTTKPRRCLKCGRMFKSFGPENRLCPLCRISNRDHFYGSQDWGGGTVREVFV
jgi:rubrerythrin